MSFVTIIASACACLKRRNRKGTEVPGSSRSQLPSRLDLKSSGQLMQHAQAMTDQLLRRMQPLWLSRHGLDMEVRFKMGRMLWEGLYPSGQDRLPYGSQVMNDVSRGLGICRPDLHRMVKLAREFKDLAAFRAQHPDVTNWDGVKKVLAKMGKANADSSNQSPIDPARVFLKNTHRTLDTLLTNSEKVPSGINPDDGAKCLRKAEAVVEKLRKLLSTDSIATHDNSPTSDPSNKEGDTQLESVELSTAQ